MSATRRSLALRFLPLFAHYAVIALIAAPDTFQGDEDRYVWFAENLTQGYYSPADEINLWNGPGYPLTLVPFVAAGLPWDAARLANALYLYLAVVCFAASVRLYAGDRVALIAGYALGLYPSFLREVHLLITESLTFLLISAAAYAYCLACKRRGRQGADGIRGYGGAALAAALLMAYLCLTKVFFGYVLLASLALALLVALLTRATPRWRTVLIVALALLFCAPYLAYTYALTGEPFYWSNAGGLSLYWMSSPYTGDLGDWHMVSAAYGHPELAENHAAVFDSLAGLDPVARDRALRALALDNIGQHPLAFVRNWLANVGRLLFNYPYSYTPQKPSSYYYMLPNMFLVVASVGCLILTWLGRRLIPYEIYALLAFAVVALGGSSLLSAYERQFRVLVPMLGVWIAYVAARVVTIGIRGSADAADGEAA